MQIQFQKSPNYSTSDKAKIGYVFHGTLGTYKGAVDWLCKTQIQRGGLPPSSSHFVIGRAEGEVMQLVQVKDVAWHAGIVSEPNERARKVLPVRTDGSWDNPNKFFVGIEFAWGYDVNGDGKITAVDKSLTEWQYRCVVSILKMYQMDIPLKPENILSHHDITSYKSDDLSADVFEVIRLLGLDYEDHVAVQVPKTKVDEVLALIKRK